MGKEAHEIEWAKAQNIFLSVDLVKAAKQQLRFLAAVDDINCLDDGPALYHAIHRYEHRWLPFLAKHVESPFTLEPLVVPLDCEWIWHCHRLNPVQYKTDCEEIYGRILDNINVHSTTEGICTRQTERLWNHMYPNDPYNFKQGFHSWKGANCTNTGPQTKIKYDLASAVKRQCSFFHRASKVIINDDHYLGKSVARYKAFLHLVKTNEEGSMKSFVPTVDIDLIWHSHQLNPCSYCKDLTGIFGKILNHDDNISEDPADNKYKFGKEQTTKLWEDTYGRKYMIVGAMLKADCGTCQSKCQCLLGLEAY